MVVYTERVFMVLYCACKCKEDSCTISTHLLSVTQFYVVLFILLYHLVNSLFIIHPLSFVFTTKMIQYPIYMYKLLCDYFVKETVAINSSRISNTTFGGVGSSQSWLQNLSSYQTHFPVRLTGTNGWSTLTTVLMSIPGAMTTS